ncbi:Hypothetical protein NCS54_00619800 [Fusarium falciforme]|uniref:Hypothetical protein n=1 Tax=Fusarium falciforme TaxID=195108 RepID=UPI0022FFEED6|nr:Hypothetical protein NCS54_00619800 [Fusarium falciforme]WAO88836.1 Hypothetical protein NCS54_00619800 [Fusarium falciforme]
MPALRQTLGFSRGRSLALFIVFGGAMSLFSILQLPFIDIDNVFCGKDPWATPGECYWFGRPGINKVAMRLHLATFLPAGALVGWQFVPASRRPRLAKYHRINGYVILGLSALGTVGALIIERRAMGGPFSARIGTWIIGVSFITAMVMGVVSIKKRQFEQHRAWMLRGWFYAGAIISMRIVLIAVAIIVGQHGWLYRPLQCAVIEYLGEFNPDGAKPLYANCSSYLAGEDPGQEVLVRTNWDFNDLPGMAVSLRYGYLFGGWTAFTLHAVGIEIYVSEANLYLWTSQFANGYPVTTNSSQSET